ncbi:ATP-binding protein [Loktanella sp. DJP18]|uniref:ATP-binding protein n=1 Tax=Loktanella sp. DJP18 TaxID=3409788 RepID=UPI003BB558CA
MLGESVVATAILDRMLHYSHVATVCGESYRLREKRRSGLLQKAAPLQDNTNVRPTIGGGQYLMSFETAWRACAPIEARSCPAYPSAPQ